MVQLQYKSENFNILIYRVFCQSLYTLMTYRGLMNTEPPNTQYPIPLWIILFGSISPLGIFLINELVKKQEIS